MADEQKKPELITVKSALAPVPPRVPGNPPEHRLAFYQRHPDHPDGEVRVSGEHEVQVALTPEVSGAIAEGKLVKVERPKDKAQRQKAAEPAENNPA